MFDSPPRCRWLGAYNRRPSRAARTCTRRRPRRARTRAVRLAAGEKHWANFRCAGLSFALKTASHLRRRVSAAPRQLRARLHSVPGTHARPVTCTGVLPRCAAADNRRMRLPAAPNTTRRRSAATVTASCKLALRATICCTTASQPSPAITRRLVCSRGSPGTCCTSRAMCTANGLKCAAAV